MCLFQRLSCRHCVRKTDSGRTEVDPIGHETEVVFKQTSNISVSVLNGVEAGDTDCFVFTESLHEVSDLSNAVFECSAGRMLGAFIFNRLLLLHPLAQHHSPAIVNNR